jgi:hypothetical protein
MQLLLALALALAPALELALALGLALALALQLALELELELAPQLALVVALGSSLLMDVARMAVDPRLSTPTRPCPRCCRCFATCPVHVRWRSTVCGVCDTSLAPSLATRAPTPPSLPLSLPPRRTSCSPTARVLLSASRRRKCCAPSSRRRST